MNLSFDFVLHVLFPSAVITSILLAYFGYYKQRVLTVAHLIFNFVINLATPLGLLFSLYLFHLTEKESRQKK